jgi:hypothetical protein
MSPISSPRAAGEVGRLLASAEMLIHGISPSRPEDDHGYDIVSVFGSKVCRVQVKSVYEQQASPKKGSYKFSVRRIKNQQARGRAGLYGDDEIDAFVFVSIATKAFWVMPVSEINLSAHKVSHSPGSAWHNAWHVLK